MRQENDTMQVGNGVLDCIEQEMGMIASKAFGLES